MNKTKLCVNCDLYDECEITTDCFQIACENFIDDLCKKDCERCKHAITEFRSNSDEEYVIGCKLTGREIK